MVFRAPRQGYLNGRDFYDFFNDLFPLEQCSIQMASVGFPSLFSSFFVVDETNAVLTALLFVDFEKMVDIRSASLATGMRK